MREQHVPPEVLPPRDIAEVQQLLHRAADIVARAALGLDTRELDRCGGCGGRRYRKPAQSRAHLDIHQIPDKLHRVAMALREAEENAEHVETHRATGVGAAPGRAAGGGEDGRPGRHRRGHRAGV